MQGKLPAGNEYQVSVETCKATTALQSTLGNTDNILQGKILQYQEDGLLINYKNEASERFDFIY